jgi:hypothetical protein
MLITSTYDKEKRTEKSWYESSSVFYSEFIEDEFKNEGDLIVTFNNGSTYKYKNVKITPDYLMFKHGGLEGSHGKALNFHIKPKYEFEKCDSKDITELVKEKIDVNLKQIEENYNKTYFISGHRDITDDEFSIYKQKIDEVLEHTPDAYFVVGDYQGVDIMSQNYLIERNVNPINITVYHMFTEPRNINPNIANVIGGFKTDEERDAAMTAISKHDIAFVRKHTKLSGTAQNILRRHILTLN